MSDDMRSQMAKLIHERFNLLLSVRELADLVSSSKSKKRGSKTHSRSHQSVIHLQSLIGSFQFLMVANLELEFSIHHASFRERITGGS